MRIPLLVIAATLLAACSEDAQPPQAAAPSPQAAPPPAAEQQATTEEADVAAAEVEDPNDTAEDNATDPCDLSGYDMSKMTVDQHEQLVKLCNQSKQ